MTTVIRDATERDLPSVLDIFNRDIITSTAVYLDHPTSLAERTSWWAGRVAAGYPVLVAEDESGVTGFASFGEFRARPRATGSPWSTASTCPGQAPRSSPPDGSDGAPAGTRFRFVRPSLPESGHDAARRIRQSRIAGTAERIGCFKRTGTSCCGSWLKTSVKSWTSCPTRFYGRWLATRRKPSPVPSGLCHDIHHEQDEMVVPLGSVAGRTDAVVARLTGP
jgi:hypothetical protein